MANVTVSMPVPTTRCCLGCGKVVQKGQEYSKRRGRPICSPPCEENVEAGDRDTAARCSVPSVVRFEDYKARTTPKHVPTEREELFNEALARLVG